MSFMLAGLSSHYVAQIAGNQLLSQQNEAAQTTTANGQNENGGPGGSNGQAGPRDRMQNGISSLTQNTEEIKKTRYSSNFSGYVENGRNRCRNCVYFSPSSSDDHFTHESKNYFNETRIEGL